MLDLSEYFGRVVVVNMDNRPDRMQLFENQCHARGIIGVERVQAVIGDVAPPPEWWTSGNGAWGCMMSHFGIVQKALLDGVDNVLIFEDDVIFDPNFNFDTRFYQMMDEIDALGDDWDMLYLGGQHLYIETSPPWPHQGSLTLLRCNNINRTHAFAVNKRFMAKFCQHVIHAPDYIEAYIPYKPADIQTGEPEQHSQSMHIDHQLGEIHRKVVTLAVNPWLCGQGVGSSSVSGGYNDEQWWPNTGWDTDHY